MSVNAAQSGQLNNQSAQNKQPGVAPATSQTDPTSDMFMTLLLAQIKNQSPLDPADPAQFVGQLVQMNQMQSTQGMLAQMQSQVAMLRELQGVTLGAQVGQQVLVQTDRIRTSGAGELTGRITLAGEEKSVLLNVVDAAGKKTVIDLGQRQAGESSFSFNPADYDLPAGNYQLQLETASHSAGLLEMQATVSGVRLPVNGGEPVLSLAGLGEFPASSLSALLGSSAKLSS